MARELDERQGKRMDISTILNRIAEEVEDHPSPTDLEDACRRAVASFIRSSDRLPEADEVSDIVEETVAAEDIVDPEDAVSEDGEEVVLTEEQEANLDEDQVVEVEGRKMALVRGKALPIRTISSPMAGRISARIVSSISAAHIALQAEGIEVPSLETLAIEDDGAVIICPECGGTECYDTFRDGVTTMSECPECGCTFSSTVEEEDDGEASVEEATRESTVIVEDGDVVITGTCWYDPDEMVFRYTVVDCGEVSMEGEEEEADDVQSLFDDIAAAYWAFPEADVVIVAADGSKLKVSSIEGNEVRYGKYAGTRSDAAVGIACGELVVDKSDVYVGDVEEEEEYGNADGEKIEVVEKDGDEVVVEESGIDKETGRMYTRARRMRVAKLLEELDKRGFFLTSGAEGEEEEPAEEEEGADETVFEKEEHRRKAMARRVRDEWR